MLTYIDARLELGFLDAREARSDIPARVAFDARGMTLLMENDAESVHYHGERRGQGHYVLNAPAAHAEGTLHRFADSTILEGFWRMNGERGFWRLHLPADTVIPQQRAKPVKSRTNPRRQVRSGGRKRIRLAA